MGKITDFGYKLPYIEALTPHDCFESGANKPLLITGTDQAGGRNDYVVKFRGAPRMSEEACMRELVASFIAAQMEINVVSPVIVNISQEFVKLLRGSESWNHASKSIGFNYGSKYIDNYSTILPAQDLSSSQLHDAQAIFAFDVLVQNPDRTKGKPNMITNGAELVIYDHELAFSFTLALPKNPKPWELQSSDLSWIKKHVLWDKIKGRQFDFNDFSQKLDQFDVCFWKAANHLIPSGWLSGQFEAIKQYFADICIHKATFIQELKTLMS